MKTSAEFLSTLRRIPDDVILSMATRPIDLPAYDRCVCAWAAAETHARTLNVDASDAASGHNGIWLLEQQYGGDAATEWQDVNHAYKCRGSSEALEEAFVDRVQECAA